jgi:hypothetical protein
VQIYHNLPGASRLKNFKGANAEERAYRAGQYFRATLLGDKNAARWCADHGVESRAQVEGVNSKGGLFVQDEILNEIIVLVEEFGAFPANARNIQMKSDTLTEFSISPSETKQTVSDAISEAVRPLAIPDWRCDHCTKLGCTKQLLLAEFPRVLMFHQTSLGSSTTYTPILVLNKIRYALMAVVCFTGGHWFTWGRTLPPGNPWHRLDDTHVQPHTSTFFPLADNMRLLLYYRLNE